MVEYGLIGRGLSHSFSSSFFNDKFKKERIDASYSNFDIDNISYFPRLLRDHPDLSGLNVTSPYKRRIIDYLDALSPEAENIGAVNVVQFAYDSQGRRVLIGHNTDARGFASSLTFPLFSEKALVLGTGGAAAAVAYAMRSLGIDFKLVSRDPSGNQIGYSEANDILPSCKLIVNATPLGMLPRVDIAPPIDFSSLSPLHLCYDLIYNPPVTLFLKKSLEKGATVKNGLQMLFSQAILSWDIWSGKTLNCS